MASPTRLAFAPGSADGFATVKHLHGLAPCKLLGVGIHSFMARLKQNAPQTGHTILVVDDDLSLLHSLESLLVQYGHTVFTASSGEQALAVLRQHEIHLMLLDYFMPEMTGEDVVIAARGFNRSTQIVLQTGYSSERPALEMLERLDIQGYHDKSEGPDKMMVWVNAALKSFRQVRALHASRDGLQHILKVTPELHRLQPLEELLHGVMLQIQGLLGLSGAVVASVQPSDPLEHSFLGTFRREALVLRVATGRFVGKQWADLEPGIQASVTAALSHGRTQSQDVLVLPLKVGHRTLGVAFFERNLRPETDLDLLEIFATQAAVAIENARLYELATVDELTRLASRSHWLGQLNDWMHLTSRHGGQLALMLVDIDRFKAINDHYGHPAGDVALAEVSRVVRQTMRATDMVGRYGGEEIGVLLPHTSLDGAALLAERLRATIDAITLEIEGHHIQPKVSIGISALALEPDRRSEGALDHLRLELIRTADIALYQAKDAGRNQVKQGRLIATV